MAHLLRPLCIGMAHGLAGSAALMLIILSTTPAMGPGLLAIAVFGIGSIVGMMVIGFTISLPLVCSLAISGRLFLGLQGAAGIISLCMGLWILVTLSASVIGH